VPAPHHLKARKQSKTCLSDSANLDFRNDQGFEKRRYIGGAIVPVMAITKVAGLCGICGAANDPNGQTIASAAISRGS